MTAALTSIFLEGVRGLGGGNFSGFPSFKAAQNFMTGHNRQVGFFGRHTVAPNSMIDWLKSPERESGKKSSATFHSRFSERPLAPFSFKANNRDNTRFTLPSNTGKGWSWAMLRIAPAV